MLYAAISWTLLTLGGVLALWALFGDWLSKWRGKVSNRRCPKCWYDLSGTVPSLRCPECGQVAKNERAAMKSRRRWRWVVVAGMLFGVGAYGLYYGSTLQERGWPSILSNRLLIRSLDENLFKGSASLYPADSGTLTRKLVGEWKFRVKSGLIEEPDWGYLVQRAIRIQRRDTWPLDLPFFENPIRLDGLDLSVLLRCNRSALGPEERAALAEARSEGRRLVIAQSLNLEYEVSDNSARWPRVRFAIDRPIAGGTVIVPLQFVPSSDLVMIPVSGPEIDARVRSALDLSISNVVSQRERADQRRATWDIRLGIKEDHLLPADFGLSLQFELLKGERTVNQWNRTLRGAPPWDTMNEFVALRAVIPVAKFGGQSGGNFDGWTLRIRSQPERLLDDPSIILPRQHWKGEFVIPIAEIVADDEADEDRDK